MLLELQQYGILEINLIKLETKMKNLKMILTLSFLLLLVVEYSNAQIIVLNKYKFGEGLEFSGKDNNYKMEISGYLQPITESKKYLDNNDSSLYNRMRLRRARLNFSGSSKKDKISYRLQLDLTGGGESDASIGSLVFDAWVAYDVTKRIKLSFGQKATATDNRELGMRSTTLQLAERSPISAAFASVREFGIFAESTYKI